MKSDSIVFVILLAVFLILFVYLYVSLVLSRVFLDISMSGLNLSGLNLSSLVNNGKTSFALKLKVIVKNRNKFSINFSDLYAEVYSNNQLIAKSSELQSNYQKINVPGLSEKSFNEELDVVLSASSINLIRDKFNGKPIKLDYIIKLKVFGVRIKVQDNHIIS